MNELIVAYYYVYTPGFTPLQNVQSLYEELSATPQQAIDNCFADLPCLIENTSAGELAVVGTLYLYPSPATHSFTVENKEQAFDRIEIVDMLGRLVRRIELDQTTQKHTVLTSDWPAGWYTVRVGGQLRPVVVQR